MTAAAIPRTRLASTDRRAPRSRRVGSAKVLAVLALIANGVILADLHLPLLRPAAGLFLLIGLPAYLILVTNRWGRTALPEALICSVLLALLGAIVLGLAANELLPLVGVARPLERVATLLTVDVALGGLTFWQWRQPVGYVGPARRRSAPRAVLSYREWIVLAAGPLITLCAVAGAIRLNNSAGSGVTVAMLCGAAAAFVLMFRWRWFIRRSVVLTTLYFVALALLLMTSLRGWTISGHDIQREFHVFALTQANGNWDISRFHDAYNACLSITVLPTMMAALTGVSGVYVFKVLLQVFFALCPVLVYLISARFGSRSIALLSTLYFLAFPTYFTDMPFLIRQEISFLFLGGTILVATNRRWSVRRRQLWVLVLSVGTVLSHYSTTYILIAVLVITVLGRWTVSGGEALYARARRPIVVARRREPPVIGVLLVGAIAAMAFAWTGPITGTAGQVASTASSIVRGLTGSGGGGRAAEVSYSLFPAPRPSEAELLAEYDVAARSRSAPFRAIGELYPESELDRHALRVVPAVTQPPTLLGSTLDGIGINPTELNTVVRQGMAKLLQLFVCIGLIAVALGRARGLRVSREAYLLAGASFVVVLSQVVLPAVSVAYGVLRAFQQSLFVFAPFLAVGSVFLLSWLGPRHSKAAAVAVAVACFLSLTGVMPQSTGGYPGQLGLADSGPYYDYYYRHPQEKAATVWLQKRGLAEGGADIQTAVPTDSYTYGLVKPHPELTLQDGTYPSLIRRGSYVLLGTTIVTTGRDTVTYKGEELTFRYPIDLLDRNKDLIYSSNGAEVYR